jgi:hypothetical protein
MRTVETLDGREVAIRYSRGSRVPYLENWEDNVLPPPDKQPWPAALLKQVIGYVARRDWFSNDDAEVLAARLGCISKFQSLNSEDAVTWSWFGTLACTPVETRRAVAQWLFKHLDLGLRASAVVVDQWARVTHPNAPRSRRGPELDARIVDPSAVIYVEAKWGARLGAGKGAVAGTKDDQIVLRRNSFRVDPALRDDQRAFVVLGVSNEIPNLARYDEPSGDLQRRPVVVAWLTWSDLARCDAHPLAAEFRRYLDWKCALANETLT